jgi:hypothetical protein
VPGFAGFARDNLRGLAAFGRAVHDVWSAAVA